MLDDFAKDGKYYESFYKVYAWFKQCGIPKDDTGWDEVIEKFSKLSTIFEQELGIAIINEMEREAKANDYRTKN